MGDGAFDATLVVVWRADLVLLGVRALVVVTAAIATAVLATDR